MSIKYVSVYIPYQEAVKLISLSKEIISKHTADGTGSLLKGLNMTDMTNKTTLADEKHELAKQLSLDIEASFEERDIALGINSDQQSITPGTVLFYVCSARDVLLGIYKDKGRQLGKWGFKVDDSKRSGVKVTIPDNPVSIINLAKKIIAKHQAQGANSLLTGLDMTEMQSLTTTANNKQEEAYRLNREAEMAYEDRDLALGFSKEQKTTTRGTVLFYVTSARDVLLGFYRGKEHQLGNWGFEISISYPSEEEDENKFVFITDQNTILRVELGIKGKGIYVIDWGDNQTITLTLEDESQFIEHIYSKTGTYKITITGPNEEITEVHSNGSQLVSVSIPLIATAITMLILQNNSLDAQAVNTILITLDSMGVSSIIINLLGNAAPTGDGLIAKANLMARGCTVLTS